MPVAVSFGLAGGSVRRLCVHSSATGPDPGTGKAAREGDKSEDLPDTTNSPVVQRLTPCGTQGEPDIARTFIDLSDKRLYLAQRFSCLYLSLRVFRANFLLRHMKHPLRLLLFGLTAALPWLATGCMKYGPMDEERFGDGDRSGHGLLVANEGNFMYGNASLSFYDPATGRVENEVFARANAQKLGDVAQSITVRDGVGWVVVNNSGVIFAIDLYSFREQGRITGFTSPRYIHFVNDRKAYVTQIWDNRICVVDPWSYRITGYIDCPGMRPENGSTEQMVQYGRYVFTNCWSGHDRLLAIDTETDRVCAELRVGWQPTSLALDCHDRLWVLTTGREEVGEGPALTRIDARTRQIERRFDLPTGDTPTELVLNGARDTLYFIHNDIWRLPVTAESLDEAGTGGRPFIASRGTRYYGLTVDPISSEVYVADAIDYVQPGIVVRHTAQGVPVDEFRVGITPGAFGWRLPEPLDTPEVAEPNNRLKP